MRSELFDPVGRFPEAVVATLRPGGHPGESRGRGIVSMKVVNQSVWTNPRHKNETYYSPDS